MNSKYYVPSFYLIYLVLFVVCGFVYLQGILAIHDAVIYLVFSTAILLSLYVMAFRYESTQTSIYTRGDLYHPNKFVRREAHKVHGYTFSDFEDSDPVIRSRAYESFRKASMKASRKQEGK